jgi:aminoglycoside phosphotransferase (APT) family kinase protein
MTSRAPELLRKERRWLPALAARLPLPVPVPVRAGEPSARFPRPWTVTEWVAGESGDAVEIGDGDQAADTLAGFLRALHREALAEAPGNPIRGVPLREIAPTFEERLPAVTDARAAAGTRRVWEEAVSAPAWKHRPVWVHGDLHPANVIVSAGRLGGIVDFGELCAGDPATDIAAAWLILPAGAAARFFDRYAAADAGTVRRARGWAVLFAVSLIGIGRAGERGLPGGKVAWGPAGWAALERLLDHDRSPG